MSMVKAKSTNQVFDADVLQELQYAIEDASKNGVLDFLACFVHPDVINHFCDAVKAADTVETESYPESDNVGWWPTIGD